MALQARRIVVHGRVQGVGFRYFVQRVGSARHLTGNVWNRWDSAVEILVEGPEEDLAAFQLEVEQGPPLARVDRIEAQQIPTGLHFRKFTIEGY